MTNSYSATLGGPLVIPQIIKWPRASYSLSYSGTHNLSGIDQLSTVPTASLLSGNFNNLSKPTIVYDPNTGAPFPGNIIPQSRFSPAAEGLLQYFPAPTYPNLLVQNFRLVANTPSDSQNIGVRLNTPLNNKDRLNFNVQYQERSGYGLSGFGQFKDTSSGSGVSASVGWSHSFKPRVNNNATITFSRNVSDNTPYFANKTNVAAVARYRRHNSGPRGIRTTLHQLHQLRRHQRCQPFAEPASDYRLYRRFHLRHRQKTQADVWLFLSAAAVQ